MTEKCLPMTEQEMEKGIAALKASNAAGEIDAHAP